MGQCLEGMGAWGKSVDDKSSDGPWILSCRREAMRRRSVEQNIFKIHFIISVIPEETLAIT